MISTLVLALAVAPAKHSFSFTASFIEGCSCKDVCVTEITGKDAGCHGLGAIRFAKGKYDGKDIGGSAAAFAWDSNKWVYLVVDAPQTKRAAVTSLMKAFLADWGAMQPVHTGSVSISKSGPTYHLSIDKGHTAAMIVRPVIGVNGKPVVHSNLASPMHSTLNQGETTSASFAEFAQNALDGTNARPFSLQGTNGFYNTTYVMKGKI